MFFSDTILAIELTNYCNANCVMCTQSVSSSIYGRKKGFFPVKVLKRIIFSLKRKGIKISKFLPFGLGESLLHPQFIEVLNLLYEYNKDNSVFRFVDFHTNGSLLNKELSAFIIESEVISRISFSIDAATAETYTKIKQNNEFHSVVENIKRFLQIRKAKNKIFPKINLQFIVMEENKNEAAEFLNFWEEIFKQLQIPFQINYDWFPKMELDTIFFKRLNPFLAQDLKKVEELHRKVVKSLGLLVDGKDRIINSDEYLGEGKRRPCSGPFKYINIAYNGDVTVCCIDTSYELKIGNVFKEPLHILWNGNKLKELRLAHIKGDLSKFLRCKECRNMDSPHLSDEEIMLYLDKIGEYKLIEEFIHESMESSF